MFRPVSLFIGLRYTRAKRRNHFISFISLTSIVGITLGVMVLITVLSVMNGFDDIIRTRILALARQVTVTHVTGNLPQWELLSQRLSKIPEVVATAPFVDGQAMLMNEGQVRPSMIIGVLPKTEGTVSQIAEKIIDGSFQALKPGEFNIVIGEKLSEGLGLGVGDKVTMVVPQTTLTPAGLIPRFKRFTIVGVFKIGTGFEYDNTVAFIHMNDAQKLFMMNNGVTGIRLKLTDLYAAPRMVNFLVQQFPSDYMLNDWTRDYGSLFEAIKLEKTMMFLILLLIITVAIINLVSTLIMVVTDKKSDIAILRTLGATPRMIMATFIVQGGVVGISGTLLGLLGGVLLATHATEIVSGIESYFHVKLFASDVYYAQYLPSKLEWSDVLKICSFSLFMSLLGTLYPAWNASRIQPAEALRYE